MKILTITANHPPYHSGGYGIRIKSVMDGLALSGYEILVVTNKKEAKNQQVLEHQSYPVRRILHNRLKAKFFPKEILFDLIDINTLGRTIRSFNPDLIYIGHTYLLSKAILPYLAALSIPLVYDEGGTGLSQAWTDHGRWFRFTGDWQSRVQLFNRIKPWVTHVISMLSKGKIKLDWVWPQDMHIIFNDELNKQKASSIGIPVNNAVVIKSGLNTQKFSFKLRNALSASLTIIIPGRIEEKKGQLDGLKLTKLLNQNHINAVLWIVGPIGSLPYYEVLGKEIKQAQLHDQVRFFPMLNQKNIVELYHQADVCFFSSYHHSGFSRVPLEAMACGCVAISYGNEGSDEIIINRENGFLVREGDVNQVGKTIIELKDNPKLMKNIVISARSFIEKEHDLTSYIGKIEEIIFSIIEENKAKL